MTTDDRKRSALIAELCGRMAGKEEMDTLDRRHEIERLLVEMNLPKERFEDLISRIDDQMLRNYRIKKALDEAE